MIIIDLEKKDFLNWQKKVLELYPNTRASFPAWPFLQSDHWAKIQERVNSGVFLKAVYQEEKIIAFFVAIEKKIPFSFKYLYLPRGPLFFGNYEGDFWPDFYLKMWEEARKKKCLFLRIEPFDQEFVKFANSNSRFVKKSRDIQPAMTSFLDLSLSEDDLLKKMAQKTRYNIRLAARKGVVVNEIKKSDPNFAKHFASFYDLISLTAKRDKFFIHSKKYYLNLIDGHFIRLFEARQDDVLLAAGLFSFFDKTVTYLHGASSNNKRELMAPYLLQWELIKLAKKEGYAYYDFYGIDAQKWPGVSRFKKGFAGEVYAYPGTFDLIFNKFIYLLYNFSRKLRLILRF